MITRIPNVFRFSRSMIDERNYILDEKYDCDAAGIDTSLDFTLQMQKLG